MSFYASDKWLYIYFPQSRSDKGRIEKSVAEKPLNEQQTVSSPEKSPNDKTSDKQSIDNLKLTVKASVYTINIPGFHTTSWISVGCQL